MAIVVEKATVTGWRPIVRHDPKNENRLQRKRVAHLFGDASGAFRAVAGRRLVDK
jgi:hypothetical protein